MQAPGSSRCRGLSRFHLIDSNVSEHDALRQYHHKSPHEQATANVTLVPCTAQVAAVTQRHPGIRRLNVKGVDWPDGTLHAALGGMTALEMLCLGGTALSDSSLSVLGTLRTLRRLDISKATLGRYGSVRALVLMRRLWWLPRASNI